MWEFIAANWGTALVLLIALACPLLHAFGHGHGRRHGASHDEKGTR